MSAAITLIEKSAIHQICSGQVVIDLASAVKELIENSLDAGATTIEIKFKESGLDGLEVTDNGIGIDPADYESLARKHYTSKIKQFEDLDHVKTYGFRGEALSSLSALCHLVVTTAKKEHAPKGVRLGYNHHGELESTTPVACMAGTTITLTGMFHSLPVRQHEFKRNIKREYVKALHIIQAYGLAATGVRLVVTNQNAKGQSTRVISTNGNKTVRENIINVFGSALLNQVVPFSVDLSAILPESKQDIADKPLIEGFISKPEYGLGRSNGDRQYLYVNSRPCTLPKITKALNELYRGFTSNQYPFIFANIKIPTDMYDVNVTPDKRTVLLHNENLVIDCIIDGLTSQLDPIRSSFAPSSLPSPLPGSTKTHTAPPMNDVEKQLPPESMSVQRGIGKAKELLDAEIETEEPGISAVPRTISTLPKRLSFRNGEHRHPPSTLANQQQTAPRSKRQNDTLLGFVSKRARNQSKLDLEQPQDSGPKILQLDKVTGSGSIPLSISTDTATDDDSDTTTITAPMGAMTTIDTPDMIESDVFPDLSAEVTVTSTVNDAVMEDVTLFVPKSGSPKSNRPRETLGKCLQIDVHTDRWVCQQNLEQDPATPDVPNTESSVLKAASVTNTDFACATSALSKIIGKNDFARMRVLGQFNLGFIITSLDDIHLFIIDQHASDEKYNFETLQQTTHIQGQKLIRPMLPGLSASEELVAMENIDILRANGFDVLVDEDKEPTQRIQVISQPVSKSTIFDKGDFCELIYLLSERPSQMVRCSKTRAMFASRACRRSVMIGDSLNLLSMQNIVKHMGEIEQPWNCPHGRPTMRYLGDLSQFKKDPTAVRQRTLSCRGSLFS